MANIKDIDTRLELFEGGAESVVVPDRHPAGEEAARPSLAASTPLRLNFPDADQHPPADRLVGGSGAHRRWFGDSLLRNVGAISPERDGSVRRFARRTLSQGSFRSFDEKEGGEIGGLVPQTEIKEAPAIGALPTEPRPAALARHHSPLRASVVSARPVPPAGEGPASAPIDATADLSNNTLLLGGGDLEVDVLKAEGLSAVEVCVDLDCEAERLRTAVMRRAKGAEAWKWTNERKIFKVGSGISGEYHAAEMLCAVWINTRR